MNKHDFCNCDPIHLPPALAVNCSECGMDTFCEPADLDEEGFYQCDDCKEEE